jgi:hypothetical protein
VVHWAATISRLIRHTVLDLESIRNALLMGSSARRINPSTLDAATGRLPVTFDLLVLLAREPGSSAG